MRTVVIVGAGELGGMLAHVLARRDVAGAIRLIDETGQVAAGKALDIAQAAPVEGFATEVVGTTETNGVAGAAVVVVADRVSGGESNEDDGLRQLRQLSSMASRAVIVCAGTETRSLVERGVRELGISRERIFGTAPEALAAAARAMVALEADVSPSDVGLTVTGLPPGQIVVPWDDATIGGLVATRLLDEPSRRRLAARLPHFWPPGPYALASAAARAIETMFGRSRRLASCFVAPDDSMGRRTRAVALPVRLGPGGIADVIIPSFSTRDRVALENAMLL